MNGVNKKRGGNNEIEDLPRPRASETGDGTIRRKGEWQRKGVETFKKAKMA